MLALAFALAAQSLAGQTAPTVALAMQPAVGLTEEEVPAFTQKISDEISAAGFVVVATEALDAACVTDLGCVESTRAGLLTPPTALLVVEVIRVGPVMQLTATGSAGELQTSGSHEVDEKKPSAKVLPNKVHAWLESIAAAGAPKEPVPPPVVETPPPTEDDSGFALTPMRSGALFAGGVGAIALAAGIVIIGAQEAVLSDPTSKGDQKENAHVLEWVGVGAAAAGVAGLAGGAALFFLE